MKNYSMSIVIPAKDEAFSLDALLQDLLGEYPGAEIIVVDDGSSDDTPDICDKYSVRHIRHPYSKGNGAAIKTGARNANGEVLVMMDADGQHRVKDIAGLLAKLQEGYDMVVGERSRSGQASIGRHIANGFYNRFASLVSGHEIKDLTSGFRAVWRNLFCQYLFMLPNGFSYPTTITMAFFRAGYSIGYVPVDVMQRESRSHLRPFKDGLRFLIIIFRVGTLYSPLKIFFPASLILFVLGIINYIYTYIVHHAFTNMSTLLLLASVITFLAGLMSEQITTLLYSKDTVKNDDATQ